MTLTEAIDRAIAETGVVRYRFLALEYPDSAVRERYAAWLMAGRPAQRAAAPTIRVDYTPAVAGACGGCP